MHRAFPEALVEAHASVTALTFRLPDAMTNISWPPQSRHKPRLS